jgi:histidyl-tRNA synthetase
MFRHERPQKGRQRQFHQIGLEAFGLPGPDIDAELIMLCTRIWQTLKLGKITLQLNTLGTATARHHYKELLIEYFSDHKKQLDKDSQNRLLNNPLRILDSKNPDMQKIISAAPSIHDHLDAESMEHFADLRSILDTAAIAYTINPYLVRGLDYYGKTIFEWTTDLLGAQGTVCAGGRYDGLVEHFGGKPSPAIGCAMGLERLIELVQFDNTLDDAAGSPQVYLIMADEAIQTGLKLAEDLRNAVPGLRLMSNSGGGSFKSQFKKADKSGALLAIILGQEELINQAVGIKSLRDGTEQTSIPIVKLAEFVKQQLA